MTKMLRTAVVLLACFTAAHSRQAPLSPWALAPIAARLGDQSPVHESVAAERSYHDLKSSLVADLEEAKTGDHLPAAVAERGAGVQSPAVEAVSKESSSKQQRLSELVEALLAARVRKEHKASIPEPVAVPSSHLQHFAPAASSYVAPARTSNERSLPAVSAGASVSRTRTSHTDSLLARILQSRKQDGQKQDDTADFREYKLSALFARLDADESGSLTAKDFAWLSIGLIAAESLDIIHGIALYDKFQQLFTDNFEDHADSDEAFISFVDDLLQDDTPFTLWNEEICEDFFFAVDANSDGSISEEEYVSLYKAFFDDSDEVTTEAFQAMTGDFTGNGVIQLQAYTDLGKDFFTSEDPQDPSKHIFGPMK